MSTTTTEFGRSTARVPPPGAVTERTPIEAAGSAEEIAGKIRRGEAFLEIVSTPWGVDFSVVEVGCTQ